MSEEYGANFITVTDEEGNDFYTTIEDEEELNSVFEKYLEIAEADE